MCTCTWMVCLSLFVLDNIAMNMNTYSLTDLLETMYLLHIETYMMCLSKKMLDRYKSEVLYLLIRLYLLVYNDEV